MVDHDEDGTLAACNGQYEWLMVDLEDVGVPLEISKAVVRRRWGGRRRRAKEDHPVITLALRSSLLSHKHSQQEAHSFTCFIFLIHKPTNPNPNERAGIST